MKKLNEYLNICIGAFIGTFIGHVMYKSIDYYNNTDLHMMYSAPWYTSIYVYGLCSLTIVGICFAIKHIIKKKISINK